MEQIRDDLSSSGEETPRTRLFEDTWPRTPRHRILGRGAFGLVFAVRRGCDVARREGVDGQPADFVAKEIPVLTLCERKRADVLAEGELLQALEHPNIVCCADVMLTGSSLYIVLERATGGDLSRHLRKQREANTRFAESTIMAVFSQMCCGLEYVHRKRIMHRDIKPANIFVFGRDALSQCDIKLGDFGLSKLFEATTFEALSTVGSPSYFSPEVCKSKPYGRKSDMWSMGVLLYELTCLAVPFVAKVIPAVAFMICTREPTPVPEEYSVDLAALIAHLLQKDPQSRPTALEVLKTRIVKQALPAHTSDSIASNPGSPAAVDGPVGRLAVCSVGEDGKPGEAVKPTPKSSDDRKGEAPLDASIASTALPLASALSSPSAGTASRCSPTSESRGERPDTAEDHGWDVDRARPRATSSRHMNADVDTVVGLFAESYVLSRSRGKLAERLIPRQRLAEVLLEVMPSMTKESVHCLLDAHQAAGADMQACTAEQADHIGEVACAAEVAKEMDGAVNCEAFLRWVFA